MNVSRRPINYADVVAGLVVIGFLAPIVWFILRGVEPRRQQRTMGDMRTLAVAIESFAIDHRGQYPSTPGGRAQPADVLVRQLVPTYVKRLETEDAWGEPLLVQADGRSYRITSCGADRQPDSENPPPVVRQNGGTTTYAADIIFDTGSFVQFPDIDHSGRFRPN